MRATTIGELISSGYTMTKEEFLSIYRVAILVGVGILDGRLLTNPDERRSTLALSLHPESGGGVTRHRLLGHLFFLEKDGRDDWTRLTLGRAGDNDLVVDDPAISEYHAYIKAQDGELLLGDLGSTNGTLVNGERLLPPRTHTLVDEDVVTFGRCSFQYFSPTRLYEYLGLGDI